MLRGATLLYYQLVRTQPPHGHWCTFADLYHDMPRIFWSKKRLGWFNKGCGKHVSSNAVQSGTGRVWAQRGTDRVWAGR